MTRPSVVRPGVDVLQSVSQGFVVHQASGPSVSDHRRCTVVHLLGQVAVVLVFDTIHQALISHTRASFFYFYFIFFSSRHFGLTLQLQCMHIPLRIITIPLHWAPLFGVF
jgi:hypothetical protein